MKAKLRTVMIATALLAPLPALAQAPPAPTGPGVPVFDFADVYQQLLSYLRQFEQLTQEIATATNTLNFYINAVQNTIRLPETLYRDLTEDVRRLENFSKEGSLLKSYTGAMLGNMKSDSGFPLESGIDFLTLVVKESQAISTAITQAGEVIDALSDQLTDDTATLSSLETQARGSEGRNQILQTLAGINATSAQLTAKQQGAISASLQGLQTDATASRERELYVITQTVAQEVQAVADLCALMATVGDGSVPGDCGG